MVFQFSGGILAGSKTIFIHFHSEISFSGLVFSPLLTIPSLNPGTLIITRVSVLESGDFRL